MTSFIGMSAVKNPKTRGGVSDVMRVKKKKEYFNEKLPDRVRLMFS